MRVLVALALALAMQQAPPRDTPAPAPPKTGTGIIKGRVVAADTGTPISRAIVTIAAPGGPFRTIYTDARGRYEARDLAPGAYTVGARPNNYQAQFLAPPPPPPMPDGSPRRVPLADGQILEWHDIALPRAGAIVGRIVDDAGNPVSGVHVAAQRPGEPLGRTNSLAQSTDEFGRYRLFRLAPGDYEILATPSTVIDGVRGSNLGFVDTFYPAALVREEAARVRVRAGQDSTASDLVLTPTRMLRVTGTVRDSQGASGVGRALVTLNRERGSHGTGADPDGRFFFPPQPPGIYNLIARLPTENREATLEYANVPLMLTDNDVDVMVVMKPTVTFSGRVSFEGLPPPEVRSGALSIRAQAKGQLGGPPQLHVEAAPVAADMTFTLRHLAGELLLRPSGPMASGWTVKSVVVGNEDITDIPREFRAEDTGRVQVVLTNRASQLTGTVTNDKGAPIRTTVVLFSEDRSLWFAHSTRVWATYPGADGRYVLRGLRAGRYYMVALPPAVSWSREAVDTQLLERYLPQATAVVVGEDEQRVVDLKLALSPEGGY